MGRRKTSEKEGSEETEVDRKEGTSVKPGYFVLCHPALLIGEKRQTRRGSPGGNRPSFDNSVPLQNYLNRQKQSCNYKTLLVKGYTEKNPAYGRH